MLVTFERLMAITFTMRYSNITDKNMKIAVLVVWISYLKSSFINWMVYLDPTFGPSWLVSSVDKRALHRYREVMGSNPVGA